MMDVFERILTARGLTGAAREEFLHPVYEKGHDPFLLPDMQAAIDRLVEAHACKEPIVIYGDYDIDGLTATTVLMDALEGFGFASVQAFIPNRFVEGYGMTVEAVEKVAAMGAKLIITVDCGSLSHEPIARASELGMDVIVTDHHNVAEVQPPAVAVINPKRLLAEFPERYENYQLAIPSASDDRAIFSDADVSSDRAAKEAGERLDDLSHDETPTSSLYSAELADAQTSSNRQDDAEVSSGQIRTLSTASSLALYPFLDLPGVGVAFKLVQALQTRLDGLAPGQEKWLLDLVALGTVCDVVNLIDENRTHVYWGLKVLAKTRRPGLRALMAVSRVEPDKINARSLGFALGPRMNAAGRLETAQIALDMLRATDNETALERAQQLDVMNTERRAKQDEIYKAALEQAQRFASDNVLVVSSPGWNHGIIGIVAAKLLEKYHKPTYVLEEMGDESKGSARSYGDFSAADAIRASDDIITKGGGHKLAAGVTLPTSNIGAFRERVNDWYRSQRLRLPEQQAKLLPRADVSVQLSEINENLIEQIAQLEPFGSGNEQPIICTEDLVVQRVRRMGADGQHVKITLAPQTATAMDFVAFNAPEHFFVEVGDRVNVWYQPDINEWQGRRSVEGRLLHLELSEGIV